MAAFALAAVGLGARIVGLVEKQVLAFYFGTGFEVDAFFLAVSVPTTLAYGAMRDLLDPSFQPLLVRLLGEGRERRALAVAGALAASVVVAGVLLALLVALSPGALVRALAPGFSSEASVATERLLRVMAPAIAVLWLSALTQVVLHGYRRFALPASGDLVLKALPTIACVAFFHELGAMALALGLLAGASGRLALHSWGLRAKLGLLSWPDRDVRQELGTVLNLMSPLLAAVLFTQIAELAANLFASLAGAGGVAARTFAKKIIELPLMLVAYGLGTVLFPHFSHLVATGANARLMTLLGRAVRGLLLLFGPISMATFFLAGPIVTLVLERGRFGLDARVMTAAPLAIYGLGMTALAIDAVLIPAYFALRDTRVPTFAIMLSVTFEVALSGLLVGPFGVAGVAAAFVLARTLRVAVLARCLRLHDATLDLGRAARAAVPILAATAAAGVLAWAFVTAIPVPPAAASLLLKTAHLVVGGMVAMAAAALVLWLLRVAEVGELVAILRQRRARGAAGS